MVFYLFLISVHLFWLGRMLTWRDGNVYSYPGAFCVIICVSQSWPVEGVVGELTPLKSWLWSSDFTYLTHNTQTLGGTTSQCDPHEWNNTLPRLPQIDPLLWLQAMVCVNGKMVTLDTSLWSPCRSYARSTRTLLHNGLLLFAVRSSHYCERSNSLWWAAQLSVF